MAPLREQSVHCTDCGSNDTLATAAGQRECLRCGLEFVPRACPMCGSYQVAGSKGLPDLRFAKPLKTVRCDSCHEEFEA